MLIKSTAQNNKQIKQNNNKKKIIHWIRHAESYSNTSELNYQIEDPGLTLKGISQCENLKKNIHMNNKFSDVELIVVSPLTRTLETCTNVFNSFFYSIPVVCVEEIREHIDNPCHKRFNISKKINKFGSNPINFSTLSEHDCMYKKFNGLEPKSNVINRCKWFVKWLKLRKESNIIVITHGNFLFPMFNDVLTLQTDNKTFFSNCEIRSLQL